MIILVILWMAIIFYFSAQPADTSSHLSGGFSEKVVSGYSKVVGNHWTKKEILDYASIIEYPIRKLAHMSEYALLSLLIFFATKQILERKGKEISFKRAGVFAIVGSAIYAITDEVHQYFVPGRSCRMFDVGVDTFGAVIGCGIAWGICAIIKKIMTERR